MSCIQSGRWVSLPRNTRSGVDLRRRSNMLLGIKTTPNAPEQSLLPAPPDRPGEGPRQVTMQFLEGLRVLTEDELDQYDITRYQVTKFYRDQIQKSGAYERLKHIVEPSLQEFLSPGSLDTSGEQDHTVVPGLQHK